MTKITGSRNFLLNLAIILFFLVLSYAYMYPLLEGKVIEQSDISHFKGMSKELQDYREETGKEAIWTNSMFSGMPGYLISVIYPDNLAKYIGGLPRRFFSSASFIFLYLIGFYILLSSLKIKQMAEYYWSHRICFLLLFSDYSGSRAQFKSCCTFVFTNCYSRGFTGF